MDVRLSIKAVVFDVGGVLEITSSTGYLERWSKVLGVDVLGCFKKLDELGLDGSIGNCTEAEWAAGMRRISGMSQRQFESFMADLWVEYLGRLNAELVDYIRGLRPKFRTGILSNSFLGAREKEQETYGFEEIFDPIIYSHEVGLVKPDPRIYALTCEQFEVEAGEIIFVDDAAVNVEGANRFGIRGVLFMDNVQVKADIEAIIEANPA